MASNEIKCFEMFWSNEDSTLDQPFIPGLHDEGNNRPVCLRPTGNKVMEVKASIPGKKRTAQVKHIKNNKENKSPQNVQTKNASIKDLCKEDKKRVADLISELARVGEQREGALQSLDAERQAFEHEMKIVQEQQDRVMTERNAIQKELWECQLLLAQYQQEIVHSNCKEVKEKEITKLRQSRNNKSKKNTQRDVTPTRESYNEPVDELRYMSHPDQHSNYSGDEQSTVKTTVSETEDNIVNVTPNRQVRLPSSPSKRKFTQKLDQLILDKEEKHVASDPTLLNKQILGLNEVETRSILCINGDSEINSQPEDIRSLAKDSIPEPILSSTQKSDVTSITGLPVYSHGFIRPTKDEFTPLKPDTISESRSTLPTPSDSTVTLFDRHLSLPTPKYSRVDTQRTVEFDPYIQENFLDQGFYASQQSSKQQQIKLDEQKQSLLLEQQRLQQILADQEKLLFNKQQQLKQQHIRQQQRLQQFQLTGKFPEAEFLNQWISSSEPSTNSKPLKPQPLMPTNHFNNDLNVEIVKDNNTQLEKNKVDYQTVEQNPNRMRSFPTYHSLPQKCNSKEPSVESLENQYFLQRHDVRTQDTRKPIESKQNRLESEMADVVNVLEILNQTGNSKISEQSSMMNESQNNSLDNDEESQILDDVFFIK